MKKPKLSDTCEARPATRADLPKCETCGWCKEGIDDTWSARECTNTTTQMVGYFGYMSVHDTLEFGCVYHTAFDEPTGGQDEQG